MSLSRRSEEAKPAGIKQIAERLGISIGTVDRALHNRTGVKPETRKKILKAAEDLHYRPNVVARNLKLNRRLTIGVYLPGQIASFFDPLREGLRSVAKEVHGVQIDLRFRIYPRLGEGDLALLEQDLGEFYDAVILTPADPRLFNQVIRKLASRGTAVICVASDAPDSARLASVCIDATVSGGIAAELLAMKLPSPADVAVITGDLGTQDHTGKLRGFAAGIGVMAPHLHLLPAVQTHESAEQAYRKTLALLDRSPSLKGIYVNTANSLPVLRALQKRSLLGTVQVVTTDLFPELVPMIESGKVVATLHQRPFTQGKIALEVLLRYLVDQVEPEVTRKLAPHIVMRSNLPLFADAL